MKLKKHIDFIRGLPCLICGNNIETQAAHVRYAEPRANKPITGMQYRDDRWVVPLCGECHALQHDGSERGYWESIGINPVWAASELRHVSGDHEAGCRIVEAFRH